MMEYLRQLLRFGSKRSETQDEAAEGDKVLKYGAGLLALLSAFIYRHYKNSQALSWIGATVLWTGVLLILLLGLNRHLFRFRWFGPPRQ